MDRMFQARQLLIYFTSDEGDALERLTDLLERAAQGLMAPKCHSRAACQHAKTFVQALVHTGGNRKQASRLLGVSYKTLLQKIRDCGLEPSTIVDLSGSEPKLLRAGKGDPRPFQ